MKKIDLSLRNRGNSGGFGVGVGAETNAVVLTTESACPQAITGQQGTAGEGKQDCPVAPLCLLRRLPKSCQDSRVQRLGALATTEFLW